MGSGLITRVTGLLSQLTFVSCFQNQRPDYSDDMEDENGHTTTLTKSKNSRSGRATRKSEEKRKAAAAAMAAAAAANGNHSSGNKEHSITFSLSRSAGITISFGIRE